jgi:FMN phosphatase YigB (HAD superfamily)
MESKGPLKSAFDAVVFDLDGTLYSIPVDWASVRARFQDISGTDLKGASLFPTISALLAERPELRTPLFEAVSVFEEAALGEARPLPGALEIVSAVSGSYSVGLVTFQGRRFCDALFQRNGLGSAFSVVLTRDDSLDRAEQLGLALNSLGAEGGRSLFVCDKPVDDVESARRAGMESALVGRRPGPEPPDYDLRSLEELRALLSV